MTNGAYNRNLVISHGCKTYLLADMLQSVLKRFPETTPSPSTTRKHEDELRAPNCTQCDWKGEKEAFHFKEHPAPKKTVLDDGTEIIRTCAWSPPGCHAVGCGIRLFVKDGELVKVEGDPDHQLTRGRLCPHCLALKEAVYHPDRLLCPMKRDPKDRGLDKWERISWDEATELIVSKTEEIRA